MIDRRALAWHGMAPKVVTASVAGRRKEHA